MNDQIKQMSVPRIILYHLLPGVSILLLGILFANPDWGFGLPSYLAILLAIPAGLIPVQLMIIKLTAKRQGVRFRDVITFTGKMPAGRIILWAVPCFLLGALAFGLFGGVEHTWWTDFSLMPDWLRLDRFTMDGWSHGILLITAVVNLMFNGLLGPITEEIYFRGFLLPRMAKLGKSAPLVNAALFSVYHFFSPWEIITRVLGVAPFAYAVWHKKNIYIGIVTHCSLNLIGCVSMMVTVLQM